MSTAAGITTALTRSKRWSASRCARRAAPEIASGRPPASTQNVVSVSCSRSAGTFSTLTSQGAIAATTPPTRNPSAVMPSSAVQKKCGTSLSRPLPSFSAVSLMSARPMPRSKTCA